MLTVVYGSVLGYESNRETEAECVGDEMSEEYDWCISVE